MTKRLVSPAYAVLCMLVVAICISPTYLVAQAQLKVLTNPDVHTAVHFDISAPLRRNLPGTVFSADQSNLSCLHRPGSSVCLSRRASDTPAYG